MIYCIIKYWTFTYPKMHQCIQCTSLKWHSVLAHGQCCSLFGKGSCFTYYWLFLWLTKCCKLCCICLICWCGNKLQRVWIFIIHNVSAIQVPSVEEFLIIANTSLKQSICFCCWLCLCCTLPYRCDISLDSKYRNFSSLIILYVHYNCAALCCH